MNQRKFLREATKRELLVSGKGAKKALKKLKRKPTVHNRIMLVLGLYKELR